MRIEMYSSGIYRVIKVSDQLIITQLPELKLLIKGYIDLGEKYIAINFSDVSYLYSGAIAILVSCYKLIKDVSGDLCLLEPKSEMVELLKTIGIDNLIPIYESESDLPGDPRQIEMMSSADFRG